MFLICSTPEKNTCSKPKQQTPQHNFGNTTSAAVQLSCFLKVVANGRDQRPAAPEPSRQDDLLECAHSRRTFISLKMRRGHKRFTTSLNPIPDHLDDILDILNLYPARSYCTLLQNQTQTSSCLEDLGGADALSPSRPETQLLFWCFG